MRLYAWVPAPFLLLSSMAWAQVPDAGMAPACGMVTPEGECDGNTVRYCDETATPPALTTYDCTIDFDPAAICQTISAEYGVDCAMPTGGECVFTDPDDNLVQVFCQGRGAGCVETSTGSACVTGTSTCTVDDVGTCAGQRALVDCAEGQGWYLDCPSFGATCSDGACVGVPEGGTCGDGLECAATLMCSDEFECVAPMVADAGTTGSDAGSTSGADATAPRADASTSPTDAGLARADAANSSGGGAGTTDSSGCSTTSGASAASGLVSALLLLGLGLVSRRRRVR
jgi:MYXO-CTERM domain-containing protein